MEDVQVLAGPPLLMSSKVRIAMGGAFGFLVFFLLYVLVLRRRLRKQSESLLHALVKERALERQYRDLVDNAHDAIFSFSPGGNIVSANPATQKLFGLSEAEMVGRPLSDWLSPQEANLLQDLEQRLAVADHDVAEFTIHTKAGEQRPVEVSARQCRMGQLLVVECIARDIAERRQAEHALQEAKLAAEAASEAKTRFLANISHEIRTPLNGVIGMTSLLKSGKLPEDEREWAELAHSSGETLRVLINDLLDLSKIEAGKMSIERIPFDCRQELAASVELLRPTALEKGLALTLDVDARMPQRLTGDPVRLRQIIFNLVGNALKFTAKGTVSVRARLVSSELPRLICEFSVTDTGIGIPPDRLGWIFQRFRQADESTTREYGGTGLGLAISKQLVDLMGGQIGVESEPGHGSSFWFRLPFAAAQAEPQTPAAAQGSGSPQALAWSARLLVAEDNAVNRRLIAAFLEKLHFAFDLANDGEDAWRMFRDGNYDLVLTDIQMPSCDGLELARRIRHQAPSGLRQVPILAVTAYAMEEERELCLAAGMNDTIAKPIALQDLSAKLQYWVERSVGDAPVRA
jgi:PAS domain S-box-containing protein